MSSDVVRVPLYGIFGDNFIRQVAVEAGNYREVPTTRGTFIEVDRNSLLNVLKVASSRAKNMVKVIPMNGNDQKTYGNVLKVLGFNQADPAWKVLDSYVPEDNHFTRGDFTPISFLKPDLYEYARLPGRLGNAHTRKIINVPPGYVILAVAGWVLSRLGSAQVSDREWVGVHAFSNVRSALQTLIDHLITKRIPGIKPETALSLWLAIKAIEANVSVDNLILEIYVVSDAFGKKPTELKGGFSVDLSRLLSRKELLTPNGSTYLEQLASMALSINCGQTCERDFAIRFTNLVYEYVNGSRRLEDLLYLAYREYIVNMKSSDFCKNNPARCYAYRYAEGLRRSSG
ncbi:type I-A CRISPR-associated protein CsaX [Acidilobus sp.]|uniref:type I-A CRISPR-associated protein CsaX n=1 Tax=Acidilobus sp. TaxID=1872109 RepID=UPI003D06F5D2